MTSVESIFRATEPLFRLSGANRPNVVNALQQALEWRICDILAFVRLLFALVPASTVFGCALRNAAGGILPRSGENAKVHVFVNSVFEFREQIVKL